MAYSYKKLKLPDGSTRDEHRVVMERILGRCLQSNEVVHHINGDKKDNSPDNLEVQLQGSHSRMHMTGRSLAQTTKI